LKRKRRMACSFKSVFYVTKFIINLQKRKNQFIASQNIKNIYGILPITQFLGISLHEKSVDAAEKIVSKTL
jgi:hypothetical protein